jgi:type IV pilus assembly protein PilN
MTQINLLPWREELRERRKREFLVVLVGMVVIAAGLVFLVDRYYRGEVRFQQSRNDLVQREIAVMDQRLAEINQLRQQSGDIRDRMAVIQDLQTSRPVIVHVFDELVRAVPTGVYFDSLERSGDVLNIEGVAASNNRVSELMRRLDDSDWFAAPSLRRIAASDADWVEGGQANDFSLSLQILGREAGPEEGQ